MSKGTRTCKVCGKEYEYCKTFRPNGTFRWQDVACSPEHGSIYLERIAASRAQKASKKKEEAKPVVIAPAEKVVEETPVEPEVVETDTIIVVEEDDIPESGTESAESEPFDFDVIFDNSVDWFDEEDEDEDDWFCDEDEDDWLDDDDEEWDGEDVFIFGDDQSDES